MKLILDIRESKLIDECKSIKDKYSNVDIITQSLDLGDALIKSNDENTILIIERKSIPDLLSSIKDGRYNEQSYRLSGCEHENHNIIYVIEGSIKSLKEDQQKMVLSSIVSLNFYKGFSVYRTENVKESALTLMQISNKIHAESLKNEKKQYYPRSANVESKNDETDYVSVVKTKKKENITENNMLPIILCNVPSISEITAKAISTGIKSLSEFIHKIEDDATFLDNITYISAKGQQRKISKTSISNIKKYFGISV